MGVNLKDIIPGEARTVVDDIKALSRRVIALDAYNALYQFLAAIRQPDGTPLMDSRGRVTSHLSGLFYRTINLMENGVKPVYVFDGKPPELKAAEITRRRRAKEEATRKYEEAIKRGDIEAARRYAQMTSRLTEDMVEDAKKLLDAMGVPWVQAPAEGEAQAAYMARKGDAWAVGSQDYDSLLFGSPRLVRNLTISGRRKLPRKNIYVEIKPEIIELEKLLEKLGITREQLIDIAILIGTDYNPDGVKGVGPKRAYMLIKTYGGIEKVAKMFPRDAFPIDPVEIRRMFLDPDVTDNYKLEWREPEEDRIREILVEEHDFSETRVANAVERLRKAYREYFRGRQMGLEAWFG